MFVVTYQKQLQSVKLGQDHFAPIPDVRAEWGDSVPDSGMHQAYHLGPVAGWRSLAIIATL